MHNDTETNIQTRIFDYETVNIVLSYFSQTMIEFRILLSNKLIFGQKQC